MKTLNDFFAVENTNFVLTTTELFAIRGGDTPPTAPGDPFDIPPVEDEDGN